MGNDTATITLTDFLLARIAEDEAVANGAAHQKIAGPFHGNWGADSALLMANGALERADRQHIARHDPARVLAECEAKRRIVERVEVLAGEKSYFERLEHTDVEDARYVGTRDMLRWLALPYADHPDFRDEWRA